MPKKRLDVLIVEQGLCPSLQKARSLIMRGKIKVNDNIEYKSGKLVQPDSQIFIDTRSSKYVGRGGNKLEKALDYFAIDPTGWVIADIGASTGGFTDCLLQHGATKVYAIDVGYGQLDYKLRCDERVVNMERTNIRHLNSLPQLMDLVVVDVSFISLRLVLPIARSLLKKEASIVVLFKPQFEVAKKIASKFKGVIKDQSIREDALVAFYSWIEQHDFELLGLVESPLKGDKGNVEYLLRISPVRLSNFQV